MGDDLDLELVLDLRFQFYPPAKRSAKAQPWFKNKQHLGAVVDGLVALPLFEDLKVAGLDDKMKPFKTPDALKALVATGRRDHVSIQSSDDDGDRELRIVILPGDDDVDIRIWCSGRLLAKHRDTILEQYIAAAKAAREALRDVAGIFLGYVYPQDRNGEDYVFPRPRPPRCLPAIPARTVVDLIDLRFHTSKHPDAQPKEVRPLTASSPPKPGHRIESDGFVALRWARTAALSEMQRAAGERELWFAKQIPMAVEDGFNDLGDQMENPGKGAGPKPPLTIYSPRWKTGYKAVVVFPDGSIEKHAWNQAKTVLKKKRLDDGSRVDEVTIVVPLREHAFMIAEEAKKAGFASVVYPGDDGVFWNPNPPGMWLTPPLGAPGTKRSRPRSERAKPAKSAKKAKSRAR